MLSIASELTSTLTVLGFICFSRCHDVVVFLESTSPSGYFLDSASARLDNLMNESIDSFHLMLYC